MKKQLAKFAIGASVMLAMAFTFSCSSGDDNGGGNNAQLSSSSANSGGGGNESDKGNDIANYKIVEIGDQVWMAENLNYNVSGSRCYNDSIANCGKYGRLYDWITAKTVCPSGWHLPSDAEWDKLLRYVSTGTDNVYYNFTAARYLKATNGWNSGGNGEDKYEFSALPGGQGTWLGFGSIGDFGFWWTDTESPSSDAYEISASTSHFAFSSRGNKTYLNSVRCVKNSSGENNNEAGSSSSVSSGDVLSSSSTPNADDSMPSSSSMSSSSSTPNADDSMPSSSSMSSSSSTPSSSSVALSSSSSVVTYTLACAAVPSTGTEGKSIAAPSVTCNGTEVNSSSLSWTSAPNWSDPAFGTYTGISVSASSGNCSGKSATCSGTLTVTNKGNDIANYKIVTIGGQVWMAENLDYYVNGRKCYNNSPMLCKYYGGLYNWATAMNLPASCNSSTCSGIISAKHQGICPSGWHIPSYSEWDVLVNYAGGRSVAGKKLKAASLGGTDDYGFAAQLGGYVYDGSSDIFESISYFGYWWSASEYNDEYFDANNYADNWVIGSSYEYASPGNGGKSSLRSVRCVQD